MPKRHIVLTALIYRESIGDEIDPTGALAETLDTEPVGYLDNVLLSLGGAETLDQHEVSCALVTFTETPDQMTEVMAALPEPSVGGLQAVGASPLCIVRDDPRVPPEIVEQFWSAEIGALGAPLEFGAFDAYAENRDRFLEVLHRHRAAAADLDGPWAGEARAAWDAAVLGAERHGVRNAQVTALAPTGTIRAAFLGGNPVCRWCWLWDCVSLPAPPSRSRTLCRPRTPG